MYASSGTLLTNDGDDISYEYESSRPESKGV